MRAAVLIAHPDPGSFDHAVASRVERGLRRAGHDVEVLDLYALGFRAAMSTEEREAYHGDDPILDPMVQAHADLVRQVDIVVFVYPTWWSGLPAILKGWLERVLVPGVGFVFEETGATGGGADADTHGAVRPGLSNIRHLVGVSTYGSPRTYVRLVNDNGRRTITRALRMSCGWKTKVSWHGLYAVDSSTPDQREAFASRVEDAMAGLR